MAASWRSRACRMCLSTVGDLGNLMAQLLSITHNPILDKYNCLSQNAKKKTRAKRNFCPSPPHMPQPTPTPTLSPSRKVRKNYHSSRLRDQR